MEDLDREIAKKLDQVAGARFDEDAGHPVRRWRNALVKWVVAAACAVGASALVVYTIESHRLPPAAQQPAPKPVTVQILPAKPP